MQCKTMDLSMRKYMLTILLLSLAMNSFIKAIGYTIPMDLCARGKLFLENNE